MVVVHDTRGIVFVLDHTEELEETLTSGSARHCHSCASIRPDAPGTGIVEACALYADRGDDRDVFDLVRATFPPGSMTGAPKIAAMRILDKLEPVRRGIYSGAIGFFDLRGGADLSVVIRTILLCGGRAYLHTVGGIVADSDPQSEWQESVDKARLLETALDKVLSR